MLPSRTKGLFPIPNSPTDEEERLREKEEGILETDGPLL